MDWKEANEKLIGKRIEVSARKDSIWVEREAEWFYSDGSVRCVEDEKEYLKKSGFFYETWTWRFWRPIPEKTKRPITNKELIEAGANWVFDKYGSRSIIKNIYINKKSIEFFGDTQSWELIENMISFGYTWSSSTEPNVRRSFEVEE